ncbi:MAG TPA: M13 family metallopeptidase [Sphingomicrobium sp.]|nr:M13 family metallopeptidase [Sphingomicrobium sp.]
MEIRWFLLAAGAALAIAAPAASAQKPVYGDWGYSAAAMDSSVSPGDDFFAYVNGTWFKKAEIAPDRTFVGIDSVLNDQIDKDVRSIIENAASNPAQFGQIGQQVGDFYASWMDDAAVEARGLSPARPYLDKIAAVGSRGSLIDLFGTVGYESPLGIFIGPDPKVPSRYAVFAGQSGLGMPGRDYYLLQGAKYDAFRSAYHDYIAKMLTLAGKKNAGARADRILALETRIAKAHWTPERSRDVKATYNPKTRAQLARFTPQLDWDRLLKKQGLNSAKTVIVGETTAVKDAAKLVATAPLETWKDYLAFHFLSDHAQFLPKAFDDARFDFYGKTLADVPIQRDRWKRGVTLVDGSLGEAVGQIYVQRHYPPEADRQVHELVDDILAALKDKIQHNSWMDEPTRKGALEKLASFDPRLGHPKKYIDYSSLLVKRDDLFGNAIRSEEFDWNLQLKRYPKPVDRGLWDMLPQTNNAYYDPSKNQITFPAAILQPPYFDPSADPASNYGSIGATIGHEIGHGFDDQGRLFDPIGRLRDWWTAASSKAYTVRTAELVKQYDSYEPIPGVHIKGRLTLGENLGDLGGLEVAYSAYRRYVAKHGEPPVIDGLTGDQRFFIAYGYSWETKQREGALRSQLLSNEHSPAAYRVNGVVRNLDAWYKAFDVKPGDKLYLPPDQRVHIWN